MNSKKKATPPRGSPQPFNVQAGSARQFKPVVAQLKTGVSAQSIRRPVAPPVYRPQPLPIVLQAKSSSSPSSPAGRASRQPVAASVYRPGKTTMIQPKAISQQRKSPTPPPAHRVEQNRVAQSKVATWTPFYGQVIQRALTPEDVKKVAGQIFTVSRSYAKLGPYQIHSALSKTNAKGYEKAIDDPLIEEEYNRLKINYEVEAKKEKEKKEAEAVAAKKAQEKAKAEESDLAAKYTPGNRFLSIDLIKRYRESKNYSVHCKDEMLAGDTWGVRFKISKEGSKSMYTSYHVHSDGAHFKAEKKAGAAHAAKEKDAVSEPFTEKLKGLVKNKPEWVDFN